MADSYHIIDGKVVPYSGGRKCNDTDAWRDATPLELQLQEQLEEYEHANAALQAEIDALRTRLEDTVRDSTNKIEALRAEVEAWRELSDHVRVGACKAIWPDRYTDARTRDVAAALKRAAWMEEAVETLRAEVEKVTCELMDAITRADKLAEALRRYRNEVPIGHQPHMLAHEVDDLLRDQEEGK